MQTFLGGVLVSIGMEEMFCGHFQTQMIHLKVVVVIDLTGPQRLTVRSEGWICSVVPKCWYNVCKAGCFGAGCTQPST